MKQHGGGGITELPEETIPGPGGNHRLAREVKRAQVMSLDLPDEGRRLPTKAKALAQVREDRQPGLLMPEEPDSTVWFNAPSPRFAEAVQEPDQLEDRGLADASLDLPVEPLSQPEGFVGKELSEVSHQQLDRPKGL